MKLLLLLLVYFTAFNKAASVLTTGQMLDNIAWLYAQFSLTFDPAMIATPSTQHSIASTSQAAQLNDASASLLPLYQYFKDNDEVVDKYESVLKFFDTKHQLKIFPSFSANELESRFSQRINFYQNEIIKQNQKPLTFNAFYELFKMCHDEESKKEEDDDDDKDKTYEKEKLNQISSISTLPQDHPLIQQFCHYRQSSDDEIKNSLKQFKLRSFVSGNRRDLNYLKLSNKFVEHLEGTKEPKPRKEDFSIHHMIPSATIVEFYQYYFELLSQKSDDMMIQNNQFDWIKIQEIQSQFAFLVDADKIWKKYGKEDGKTHERPVDNYVKNPKSAQEDFVRFWFRFPPGLLFYGPKSEIRKDDPSYYSEENIEEYINFSNDFEERVINIVGKEYYDKVAKLNTEILDFNAAYKTKSKTKDELMKMAMKINNRLRTIHREAPWANKIIAPFDTNEWNKKPNPDIPARIWEIVKMYDWAEKAIAQQSDWVEQFDLARQLSFLSIGLLTNEVRHAASSHGGEFKRKKRMHFTDARLSYVQKLDMKCEADRNARTTTEKPKGFWCSPFYLRLNPMMYFWCRITGHQNLHFF